LFGCYLKPFGLTLVVGIGDERLSVLFCEDRR